MFLVVRVSVYSARTARGASPLMTSSLSQVAELDSHRCEEVVFYLCSEHYVGVHREVRPGPHMIGVFGVLPELNLHPTLTNRVSWYVMLS